MYAHIPMQTSQKKHKYLIKTQQQYKTEQLMWQSCHYVPCTLVSSLVAPTFLGIFLEEVSTRSLVL